MDDSSTTIDKKSLKGFFAADKDYREMTSQYGKADGVLALLLYALMMTVYHFMGVLYVHKKLYLGIPVNLALIVICVGMTRARKQKLSSVGITRRNAKKAFAAGLGCGIVLTLVMNVIPSMLSGGKIIAPAHAAWNIVYYFVFIALCEEIVFRGYIQTRIYGLIKSDTPAILLTGVMFYLMHLPFQGVVNGMRIGMVNMAVIVALHCMFNFLHRKYNSLVAPTVLHGLLDWGGNLLK